MTVDLGVDMARPRSSAHSATRAAWAVRALAAEGMSELENESVKSSAYEEVNWGDCG